MNQEQDNQYELSSEDVIKGLESRNTLGLLGMTFTGDEIIKQIRDKLCITSEKYSEYAWIGDGVTCKILSANSNSNGWKTGRLKICLQFIPDETDQSEKSSGKENKASLDEFR